MKSYLALILMFNLAFSEHKISSDYNHPISEIFEFDPPSNPMLDRAKGYLLKGKAKTAITNYGRLIDWDYHPSGGWGDYTYLPNISIMAGVPGQSYTYNYEWYHFYENDNCPNSIDYDQGDNYVIWCSEQAYSDESQNHPGFSWYEDNQVNFVSVVFESYNDRGILGERLCSPYQLVDQIECIDACEGDTQDDLDSCYYHCSLCKDDNGDIEQVACEFTAKNQFCLDNVTNQLMISLPIGNEVNPNPNKANVYGEYIDKKGVGLVFPWAKRPSLIQRLDAFDLYDYGEDLEEWSEDDNYVYYGANVAESWFTNYSPSTNTDWHAASDSRLNTHNTQYTENDFFSGIPYLDLENHLILAHSEYKDTWPIGLNSFGELAPIWPGWNAKVYSPNIGAFGDGCYPKRVWNDECWIQTDPANEQFASDNDVYMEFDDRWAHRGNVVENNVYQQTGYPMGLKVMLQAHSYGMELAEDILFFTLKIRNESGDGWCAFERDKNNDKYLINDHNGLPVCGDAMIMPDGTKLNHGDGFNYKNIHFGFYMDADVVSKTLNGSFEMHSNDDDFMEYYDCAINDPNGCDFAYDDLLRVSMAMIYDYDFNSNGATDIGIVAAQLLDSPFATEDVDLNNDGYVDILEGEKLKMTNWHWFDWHSRPGVLYDESSSSGCYAGNPGCAQVANKEEIMYKVMSGDTTNLSEGERDRYFHTPNPSLDDHEIDLNPHFDSLDGLSQTSFFMNNPDGLECVFIMNTGPFSLEVGEQTNLSFTLLWGENYNDLIDNAKTAQLMYNNYYTLNFLSDINGDFLTNVIDIFMIVQIILGEIDTVYNADINTDGNVDVIDIMALVDIVLNN